MKSSIVAEGGYRTRPRVRAVLFVLFFLVWCLGGLELLSDVSFLKSVLFVVAGLLPAAWCAQWVSSLEPITRDPHNLH